MEDQDFRISPKFYKKILYYTLSDGTRPIKYPFPIENKEDLLCEIEKVTTWNRRSRSRRSSFEESSFEESPKGRT